MRNIAEFPITSDEVIEVAEQAFDHLIEKTKDVIGTPAPYAMMLLLEFIREEEPALIAYLERKSEQLKQHGKP